MARRLGARAARASARLRPPVGDQLLGGDGYVGILPLALAAAAPWKRRGTVLFLVAGLLGIWLSLGDGAPLDLHRLAYRWLPGYGSFRVPTRALFVTALSASLLAAEGLEALRSAPTRGRALRALAALAIVAAACLLLPLSRAFPFDRAPAWENARVAVALAAAGAAWVVLVARGLRGPLAGAAAVALVFADGWVLFSLFNEVAPTAQLGPPLTDLRPLVPAPPSPRRVGVLAKWGATANAPLRQGWEGVTGYGPMSIERVRDLLEATQDDEVRRLGPMDRDATFPSASATSRLWPLFAAPMVVADHPLPLPEIGTGAREWENPLVAYRAEALPRVFWTGSWEVAPDERVTVPLLAAASGDCAVLPEPPPGLGPERRRGRSPPRTSGWTPGRSRPPWWRPATASRWSSTRSSPGGRLPSTAAPPRCCAPTTPSRPSWSRPAGTRCASSTTAGSCRLAPPSRSGRSRRCSPCSGGEGAGPSAGAGRRAGRGGSRAPRRAPARTPGRRALGGGSPPRG